MKLVTALLLGAALFVVGIILGVGAHATWMALVYPPRTVEDHWRVVDRYNRAQRDSRQHKRDPRTGLSYIDVPQQFEPSLAALVAAGELEHVDLVLPEVPMTSRINQHWMKWANEHHDEVIYGAGNHQYASYRVAGRPPLHLQLWFRSSASARVQALIHELEALAREESSSSKEPEASAPGAVEASSP